MNRRPDIERIDESTISRQVPGDLPFSSLAGTEANSTLKLFEQSIGRFLSGFMVCQDLFKTSGQNVGFLSTDDHYSRNQIRACRRFAGDRDPLE